MTPAELRRIRIENALWTAWAPFGIAIGCAALFTATAILSPLLLASYIKQRIDWV